MPTLYFNNFRGFKETFLPLKNMNFFVGENSTGKTSVLKLIKLLSEKILLGNIDFNIGNVELGYFSEIANYGKKHFEIGFHNEKDAIPITAIKLLFIEKEGLPFLQNICLINSYVNLEVRIEKDEFFHFDQYKYNCRYELYEPRFVSETKKEAFFATWIKNNNLKDNSYELNGHIENPESFFFDLEYSILPRIRNDMYSSVGYAEFLGEIAWLAPIRTEPRRTYDNYKKTFNPDGSHTPYILKDLIGNDKNNNRKFIVEKTIEMFGTESGLFDKIEIAAFEKSETSPFEIRIFLNGHPLKITNVGYGISQILPLITEVIARPENSWFAIQQPEIHLHPKAQAAFGDFIFSFAVEKKNFIIETHSDYMIDRFRLRVNKQNEEGQVIPTIESQVIFFKRTNDGNELVIIPIHPDGSYDEDQPKEFREFFIKEQINLLSI